MAAGGGVRHTTLSRLSSRWSASGIRDREVLLTVETSELHSVTCHGCGREVELRVRSLGLDDPAWRWFDCPHCRRPNFVRLAGQILRVVKDQPES
jgi:hypothetical protein